MEFLTEQTELNESLGLKVDDGVAKLYRKDGNKRLAGQPRVRLDTAELLKYLRKAHLTTEGDKLAPFIRRLGLATPHHGHISALHHQAARQRDIIVAENPALHLVWYHDRIFIKPIPPYMLSHAFWKFLAASDQPLWRACAGFMRTYWYLIQYEIDFQKASSPDLALIPSCDGQLPITFERFIEFLEPFASLDDDSVSARYTFGELRLTRLNVLARIFLGKMTYHHIHAQLGVFMGRFLAPFITLFLVLTTVLTAMQVELAVQAIPAGAGKWDTFARASRWFSVVLLVLVLLIMVSYLILLVVLLVHDFCFAKKMEYRKQNQKHSQSVSDMKSGVV